MIFKTIESLKKYDNPKDIDIFNSIKANPNLLEKIKKAESLANFQIEKFIKIDVLKKDIDSNDLVFQPEKLDYFRICCENLIKDCNISLHKDPNNKLIEILFKNLSDFEIKMNDQFKVETLNLIKKKSEFERLKISSGSDISKNEIKII